LKVQLQLEFNTFCLLGSLDKSVIIWEMPRDILARSQAEESLRGRREKVLSDQVTNPIFVINFVLQVEDWNSKDISRWLTWLDLPHIPSARLENLSGTDVLQSSASALANLFGLGRIILIYNFKNNYNNFLRRRRRAIQRTRTTAVLAKARECGSVRRYFQCAS